MKIGALAVMLPKIQDGAFVYIKRIINIQIITKFKITARVCHIASSSK